MPETRIGEYRLTSGTTAVPFWRLVPGTDVTALLLSALFAQVAPSDPATFNTLTLPPRFGIFDIVIRMSEPAVEAALTDAQSVDLLVTNLTGAPAATPMPMWEDGSGTTDHRVANISFAVRIPLGQPHFEGTLFLTATKAGTASVKTVRLPLRVGEWQRAADLFVFFIATAAAEIPRQPYCWIKVPTTQWVGAPTVPLPGADVDVKMLRDNSRARLRRNRRVLLRTDPAGLAAFPHRSGGRNVVGVPIDWPLILTATLANHVPRAHLARLASGDIDHNQSPHELSRIHMIPVASAATLLLTKTVLIDPGHAVVYGYVRNRRSQEWFVAHRIGMRVREILRTRFTIPEANIFMTRTAGIGLIAPGDVTRQDAPERGARDFVFDPGGRRLRIARAVGLHDLSDLVLTGDDDTPANVPVADRDRLIGTNATTVGAIVGRIQGGLPAGQRVQPSSVRWHAATSRYVCRIERHPPVAGLDPIVDDDRAVAITTADWFTLDAAMIAHLADRTVRWSLEEELGSGPGADAATGRPSFRTAMKAAMQAENAGDYMRRMIVAEFDLEEPYAAGTVPPTSYRGKESMGWHVTPRRAYINRKDCDVAVTIHENADGAGAPGGTAMLVGQAPPATQVRAAKLFMKYADPFDKGLQQGGVVENDAGMLQGGNTRRAKHAYYELDFMTSTIADNPEVRAADPARYQYEAMVENAFIDGAAEQIVAAIVEFLLDAQADIDTVEHNGSLPTW